MPLPAPVNMLFELLVIEVVKHGLLFWGSRGGVGGWDHRFEITHMTFFAEFIPKSSFKPSIKKYSKITSLKLSIGLLSECSRLLS
jgi:hypothetical protein